MFKNSWKLLTGILIVVFFAGCAARTYTQVKDRVDQDRAVGNAGYLSGNAPAQDTSNLKTTRTTYVLELQTPSAKKQNAEMDKMIKEAEEIAQRARQAQALESSRSMPPPAPVVRIQEEVSSGVVEYTVQEGDTLQKISKKFFDSYSKWQKIYDLNKEKISNPNRIKPGTVLMIPKE